MMYLLKRFHNRGIGKRLLSLCLALVMLFTLLPAVSHNASALSAGETIYLKPNSNWLSDSARFAVYFFGAGETWASMSPVNGATSVYSATVPTGGYTSAIFCRMNPGTSANNWNNVWNQTNDLTIPTGSNNCYTVSAGAWSNGSGTWSSYTPPASGSYILAGDSVAVFGTAWDPSNQANKMTYNSSTGLYEKVYSNVSAGTLTFKVTDGTWNYSWGDPNSGDPDGNYVLKVETTSNVTITFNTSTKTILATAVPVTQPMDPVTDVTIHFRNTAAWSNVYAYAWDLATETAYNGTWPGKTLLQTEGYTNWYTLSLSNLNAAEGVGFIFSNGTSQTDDILITKSGEYWFDATLTSDPPASWEESTPKLVDYNVKLHFANTKNWSSVYLYTWGTYTNGAWPGERASVDADGFYTVELNYQALSGNGLDFIFSGDGQTVDLALEASDFVNNKAEKWIVPTTADSEGKYNAELYDTPDAIAISPIINDRTVTFKYKGSTKDTVTLYGSMNNWESGYKMTANSYGVFSVTLQNLDYGLYEYKFVVNNSWITDPSNPLQENGNSAFIISNPDADINKVTVKVHYSRSDGAYTNWNVHAWSLNFADQFDFNSSRVATIEVDGRATNYISFIIRKSVGSNKWVSQLAQQDVDLANIVSGTVHVYVTVNANGSLTVSQKNDTDVVISNKIAQVNLDYDQNTVTVTTSRAVNDPKTAFAFYYTDPSTGNTTASDLIRSVTTSGSSYTFTLNKTLDLITLYRYTLRFLEQAKFTDYDYPIGIVGVYASDKFASEYTYTGSDLGATYTAAKTTFKVWAPTAEQVKVKLYATGSDSESGATARGSYAMTKSGKGVWSVSVSGNLKNIYYVYEVTVNGETVEACDPYARATGVNGNRAMVIDLDATDPSGWSNDSNPNPLSSYTDAVLYELHVRDFSIDDSSGVSSANRGKYLAFTETGTTTSKGTPTGLDHLKNLGITHLHLLPVYDYASVDESSSAAQFNWGYDPQNYNVPEGSYSSNPYNGTIRVTEFKQMVKSLHDNGISVVMDVVYNHVYDAENFCYNQIVPGYFSRQNADGSYSNGSGCGNDTASEREMVRDYIVDSVLYWVEEYHIDGFRFDLVGLLDATTINEIVETVHAVRPDVIFYGEGWTMGTAVEEGNTMATQANSAKTPGFAYFSDTMRNLIAGSNGTSTGFATGSSGREQEIVDNFKARPYWSSNPAQIVQYASCHDNYTLVDKIILSTGRSSVDSTVIKMNNLTAAIYLTAQGIPFIHAGEEFLREKLEEDGGRCENSYNASDYVNHLEWSDLDSSTYATNAAYYQGLIEFRKAHPALRLRTASQITSNVSTISSSGKVVAMKINGGINGEPSDAIIVIYNANSSAKTVSLPTGTWKVCVEGTSAGNTALREVSGSVSVSGISATVLVKGELGGEEEPEEITVSFSCPAGVSASAIATTAGTSFVLPAPTGAPTANAYSYQFAGWGTATVSDTTTKPSLYTAGQSVSFDSSITLYAVYSYTSGTRTYYTTTLKNAAASITVSFSCPEGVSANSITTTAGASFTLPTPTGTPTANAYTYSFVGWVKSTVSDTTTKPTTYNAGTTATSQSSLTYYALYSYRSGSYTYYTTELKKATITVSFSCPEGVSANSITTTAGASFTLPTPTGTPTANAYTYSFVGWVKSTVSDTTTKPTTYNAGTTATSQSSLTYYALYSYRSGSYTYYTTELQNAAESIVISFSCPDGVSASTITTTAGTAFTLPTPTGTPTANAYSYQFAGWATATVADSTTAPTLYTAGKSVSANESLTLYAVYTYSSGYYTYYTTTLKNAAASITVSFSTPEGVSANSITSTAGASFTLPTPTGTPTANAYTYSFVGWVKSAVSDTTTKPTTYSAGTTATSQSSLTYYALYSYRSGYYTYYTTTLKNAAASITVSFSTPEGVSANSITTTAGASFTLPTPTGTPTANAYTYSFVGWVKSTVSDTTTKPTTYNAGTTATSQSSLTYYALYSYRSGSYTYYTTELKKATITVSFSTPEGVSASAITTTAGTSFTLPTPTGTPTANAYTYSFVGWVKSSVSDTTTKPTTYSAGTTATSQSSLTYYALYSYRSGSYTYYTTELQNAAESIVISFSCPAGVSADAIYTTAGTTFVLPTPTGTPTANAYSYQFAGWVTATVSDTTTKPTIYEAGKSVYSNDSLTLYAVYTYTSGSRTYYTTTLKNAAASITVSFSTPEGVSANSITTTAGASFTLPTPTGTPTANAYTYSFVGWVKSSVNDTTTKPTTYSAGTTATSQSSLTYYALYSYRSGSYTYYTTELKKATITVSFSTPEGVSASSITTTAGTSFTLPTPTGTPTANAYTYSFVGWVKSSVNDTTTKPTTYSAGTTATSQSSLTYYALYSYRSGSYTYYTTELKNASEGGDSGEGTTLYQVAASADLASDTYAILVKGKSGYFAMQNQRDSQYRCLGSTTTDFTSAPASITAGDTFLFTVTYSGGKMTIRDASGNYLYGTSSSSGVSLEMSTSSCTWTPTFYSDGSFSLKGSTGYYLSLRDDISTMGSNGNPLFAVSSSLSTGSCYFYLYRATEIDTTCSHSYTSKVTTAATCTEDGVMTFTCSKCGDSYTEKITATGHSYNDGLVTTQPTCTEEGIRTYTCSKCGDRYTEAVSATGHSFVNGECFCGASQTMTIYFQNNWMWSDVCMYFWGSTITCEAWPGSEMTKVGNDGTYDIYVYEVPTDITGMIINGIKNDGSNGRDQTPDITNGWYDGICYSMVWDGGNAVETNDIENILPNGCAHSSAAYTDNGDGTHTLVCGSCGYTATAEHSFANGSCACGYKDADTAAYYLFGYIDRADYGVGDDYATLGKYKFDKDGKLTTSFQADSYVGVKSGDNACWYQTDGWLGSVTTATLIDANYFPNVNVNNLNKLYVPGGVEITFTLKVNDDHTVTLSYEADTLFVEDTSGIQDGLTFHAWCWSFNEIENQMSVIAEQGFTAIQTSPVQPLKEPTNLPHHSVGGNWWVYYQPVDFVITTDSGNALGTKSDLEQMIATAHEYGIKVIVDVVANHLGNASGNDLAEAIPQYLRNSSYWHDITQDTSQSDYANGNRAGITGKCMGGLPDLNTANKEVQNYVLNFLKECIDVGVDGFRFDAAKHIETPDDVASVASDFWPTVIGGARSYAQQTRGIDLYCYGETLDEPGGMLPISAYTKYMSVTDNSWGNTLRGNIASGTAAINEGYNKAVDPGQLVLWAESHDTYADGSSSSVSAVDINKTWALVAARADAMGLYFCRPEDLDDPVGVGATNSGWNTSLVQQANRFHNYFAGQDEAVHTSGNLVYVERGNSGVVIVAVGASAGQRVSVSVPVTAMKTGTYTDQLTGSTFRVSGGYLTGTISSSENVAIVYTCAHSNVEHISVDPTCDQAGETYDVCTDCGAVLNEQTIAATGHSYTSKVTTTATCAKEGVCTYTCSKCGDSYTEAIPKTNNHSYSSKVTTAATCETDGVRTYTCAICGGSYTEAISAMGHSYSSKVTAPTCTANGYTTYTCSRCGHSYTGNTVAATGHSYTSKVTTAATCETNGVRTYTCSECQHSYTEVIAAIGHNYRAVVTAPTCTDRGYTTNTCANCGDSYVNNYVAALGHSWNNGVVIKEPTETSTGERRHTCITCGETKIESIPVLTHTHNYTSRVVAPTCTEEGYTLHSCTCGSSYVTNTVSATGHSYSSHVTTAATCARDGIRTYTCSKCGNSYTEVIPKTGKHSYTEKVTAPTCVEPGYSTFTCSVCGDQYTANAVAASGHSYTYTNNGANHTVGCAKCDYIAFESHSYENGSCLCGAVEVTTPTEANIKIGHALSLDSDLRVKYRVKYTDIAAAIPNYVTEGAYLVIEKDVYPANSEMRVDIFNLNADLTADPARMVFDLKGIQAAEMGSELRAVLHIFDAEGKEYISAVDVYSIRTYVESALKNTSYEAQPKLCTMLIDLLNYGAAAQVNFNRRTEELVNAGFEAYQQYATKELAAELTDVKETISNDRSITAVSKMGFSINLADRTEINAKMTMAAGYTMEDISKVEVFNAAGEVVDTITEFKLLVDDNNRVQLTFSGVKSVNMRDMFYFVVYVGDQVASDTFGYSIEASAKTTIANSTGSSADMILACMYYGDSAAAYFGK